jgi:hypothetical protein
MGAKYLSVSYYPHNDKQLGYVIDTLNNFILYLNSEFSINLNFRAYSTIDLNLSLHNLIQNFLLFSERHFGYVDINYIVELYSIIKNPSNKMLNYIKASYKNNNELSEFFLKSNNDAISLKVKKVFQFISLQNLKLKDGQGPWGITYGVYPFSVAIDTKGYKEVIYHEFLHQLNVSEGYYEITLLNSCENSCWMQYNPTLGSSLCERHAKELIEFARTLD